MGCCAGIPGRRARKSFRGWSATCAAAEPTSGSWRRSKRPPVREEPAMTDAGLMQRRDLVKALGGGILVLVNLPPECLDLGGLQGGQRGYSTDVNAYLHIAEYGKVTLFFGKIEMGQGVMTSLTQM